MPPLEFVKNKIILYSYCVNQCIIKILIDKNNEKFS